MNAQNSYYRTESVNKIYHDTEYGFALCADDELFERLVLEINQAGLSWKTILKKRSYFRNAYASFSIVKVAVFDEKKKTQLLKDEGIIRNSLTIRAAIYNARVILKLQETHDSFSEWLYAQNCVTLTQWVTLFRKTFTFTGAEITKEFLRSTGYVEGAHEKNCSIYHKVLQTNPYWTLKKTKND